MITVAIAVIEWCCGNKKDVVIIKPNIGQKHDICLETGQNEFFYTFTTHKICAVSRVTAHSLSVKIANIVDNMLIPHNKEILLI